MLWRGNLLVLVGSAVSYCEFVVFRKSLLCLDKMPLLHLLSNHIYSTIRVKGVALGV